MSDYRVVRYRRPQDIIHGVTGSPGRKFTPFVGIIGDTIKMIKVPNDEATKWFSDLYPPGEPKPWARELRAAGKRMGITKEAKEFLKDIK